MSSFLKGRSQGNSYWAEQPGTSRLRLEAGLSHAPGATLRNALLQGSWACFLCKLAQLGAVFQWLKKGNKERRKRGRRKERTGKEGEKEKEKGG
jgi:hypothetical protein